MDRVHVVIVGAGAAGLFAGALLAEAGVKVVTLEKNSQAGRKLLLAGQGQCNLTHDGDIRDFIGRYGDKVNYVKHSLYAFTNTDLRRWFEQHGLKTFSRDDGKVFPVSLRSADVMQTLLKACAAGAGKVLFSHPVRSVDKDARGFSVYSDGLVLQADYLIIATGGRSYPQTGSTGDGYTCASSLGHTIMEPHPALAPLYIKDYRFAGCAGIALPGVRVTLRSGEHPPLTREGDVLFTHQGLSGPAILHVSRYARSGDTLDLCLAPGHPEQIRQRFMALLSDKRSSHLRAILQEFVPRRLAEVLLDIAGLKDNPAATGLSKTVLNKLAGLLSACPFTIQEVGGFDIAMATAGGVNINEVAPKTMQSRLVSNLYFAGEVLDVDGDTGGYNLQFAFSSAHAAATDILKK